MNYKVKTTRVFERQAKRLFKKFPTLVNSLQKVVTSLKQEPKQGDYIGFNCYKIRLAISEKGKGKSSGSRIIIHIIFQQQTVYLLAFYDKSETGNIAKNELLQLLKQIPS